MLLIDSVEEFLKAIQEKKHFPEDFQLCLRNKSIRAEEAKVLAIALQSEHCPSGLVLDLSDNRIGDIEASAMAMALRSGHCPPGLRLNLRDNLGDIGADALASALQSKRCPPGLQLDLDCLLINAESKKTLQKAWKLYYADQRENFLRCTALQHGYQQSCSPLTQLPREILKGIYRYLLPITPITAKLTEISAKVFRKRYALLCVEKTKAAELLDSELEAALFSKTLTGRAEQIDNSLTKFIKNELGTFNPGKFVHSPTIALLCKYHLLARNRVHEDPKNTEHFQLSEHTSARLTLK